MKKITSYDDLVEQFSQAFKVCTVRELSEADVEDALRETLFELFEAAYNEDIHWYEISSEKFYMDVFQKIPKTRHAASLLERWMTIFNAWQHAWDNVPLESWIKRLEEEKERKQRMKEKVNNIPLLLERARRAIETRRL